MATVDERILDVADRLHHEQPLPLAVHGLVMLVVKDRGVGTDADIEVAVGRRLPEKLNMAAVQEVIAAGNEYFLVWHILYFGRQPTTKSDRQP